MGQGVVCGLTRKEIGADLIAHKTVVAMGKVITEAVNSIWLVGI
jgi:hypothetical protein